MGPPPLGQLSNYNSVKVGVNLRKVGNVLHIEHHVVVHLEHVSNGRTPIRHPPHHRHRLQRQVVVAVVEATLEEVTVKRILRLDAVLQRRVVGAANQQVKVGAPLHGEAAPGLANRRPGVKVAHGAVDNDQQVGVGARRLAAALRLVNAKRPRLIEVRRGEDQLWGAGTGYPGNDVSVQGFRLRIIIRLLLLLLWSRRIGNRVSDGVVAVLLLKTLVG